MKSKFISVAVLAIAALASLGSYADGMGGRAPVPANSLGQQLSGSCERNRVDGKNV
jgi:hypothetical protein